MEPEVLLVTSRFRVERVTRPLADGRPYAREVVRHPGAVVIVPQLPDGRLVFVRNHRMSVDETLIELPAGTLDPGETPEATAYRELAEETGYRAATMQHVLSFYMSPGILDEQMHLFFARDLTAGPMDLDAGEQLEPFSMSLAEALQRLDRGEIKDGKTIAALLYFERQLKA